MRINLIKAHSEWNRIKLPLISQYEKLPDDFVTLSEIHPDLKYFCSSITDVWTLLQSNSVNTYTKSDYASMGFSKNDMYRALHRHTIESGRLTIERHLSRWWLSTIPNARRAQSKISTNIKTPSLGTTIEMYVSLRRMSYFMCVRSDKLKHQLIKNNISPLYQITDNNNQLEFYEVSSHLDKAIRSLAITKSRYSG